MKRLKHIATCPPVMRNLVAALLVLLMVQSARSYDFGILVRHFGKVGDD